MACLDVLGGYLPSVNINFLGLSKDMAKRLPQLHYIKMTYMATQIAKNPDHKKFSSLYDTVVVTFFP